MIDEIKQRFEHSVRVTAATGERLAGAIERAVEMVVECLRGGGGVYVFGNGGSAADAQHIAGELVGRFLSERRALKAQALTTDTSILTSLGNDYGFEGVFVRQLEAAAGPGDVAIGLSTSGNSPNVVAALARAREMGLRTLALTGAGGGRCAALADVLLDVPETLTPRVQEAHAVIYHVLCEMVERAFVEDRP
ncbi:MAG TPA: D-sedoheptulose 7-phosphate isomerase [Phycisphaerae bacterium]|nr:D-sedoheptulose 7-phosphate isomerase [Phycisphaerae bacterium]